MCFRKAGDKQAEIIALARMQEDDARQSNASGDVEGFKAHLEAAISHFSHARLFEDASRCLIRMSDFDRAARELSQIYHLCHMQLTYMPVLWLKQRRLDTAAPLFQQAKFHGKAAVCFRIIGRHDDAAISLRNQGDYDKLVSYLSRYVASYYNNNPHSADFGAVIVINSLLSICELSLDYANCY